MVKTMEGGEECNGVSIYKEKNGPDSKNNPTLI